ncbi:ABC transporter permease [Sphingomonas sp.]|uniref:ABC transporter permease n=1 Tax=Sphingomonas sp. TaxID=28214 RepID=UPI0025E26D88|nr:ABC transporter permease [Sphingomonas sp.]
MSLGRKRAPRFARRIPFGPMILLPAGWIVLLLTVAFFVPLQDPLRPDFLHPAEGFSRTHLLGTDLLGRDLLSRLAHGARISLTLAFLAPVVGFAVALPSGMAAGHFKGWTDRTLSVINDTILAFPRIILAIGMIFYVGATLINLTLVISLFTTPNLFRITRSTAMTFSDREFVLAARALGASELRILVREILPNVIQPTAAYALMTMSIVVVLEGSLSFLGIGVPPPTPTWGKMIAEGYDYIFTNPQLCLIPSATMFLTILSFNLIGDQVTRLTEMRGTRL